MFVLKYDRMTVSMARFQTSPSLALCSTGESFFDAGRSVTDLLTRNFLKAYGVWW
jgi:hypothetical protein